MSRNSRLIAFAVAALLPLGCSNTPQRTDGNYPLTVHQGEAGIYVPEHGGRNLPPLPDNGAYDSSGPFTADMVDLAAATPAAPGKSGQALLRGGGRIETPIPEAAVERLREQARFLPPSLALQDSIPLADSGQSALGPVSGTGFDSLDITDCCTSGANVPPDPELAVGPGEIIAVVNVAFEIYDKSGGLLVGPTRFANFFAGVPGCSSPFDPNVLYDEDQDRFVIGVDGGGGYYCVAASATGDPTGAWHRYSFQTASGADFFDYPHAAVGDDAIYMGANIFGAVSFKEGRIWALDKTAMYAGSSMAVVTRSTGGESTPHPVYLHGAAQGTWPHGDPEYILTDGPYDGNRYGVWRWTDPFGANLLSNRGTVNLFSFTGTSAGFPIDAPQAGGGGNIQANDFRVQDAEYRDGYVWMTSTIACNPGGGTVNCLRWAQIDPTGPSVVDAGVLGTPGEHRIFADGAVDACGDFGVGYTKTSSSMYPAVWAAGREAADPGGTLQAEMQFKAGEITYTAFDSLPRRWGDYSEMAIDPDGVTFWYLGEYSKNTGSGYGRWGTWIGSFSFASCDGQSGTGPGAASNPSPANGATGVDVNADLAWTAGTGATAHHVYFGVAPNLADQGITSSASFALPTLAYDTTYNWQVDETDANNNTTSGTVWSFTTGPDPSTAAPGVATSPNPANNATGVDINPTLSWTAGSLAASHDVYFGTSSSPGLVGNQTGTTYAPATLAYNTQYFWRIDEKSAYGVIATGDPWTFTTGSPPPSGSLHVSGLAGSAVPDTHGRWQAVVQVSVADQNGNPVQGVAVSGNWSNGANGTGSCTTDAGGQCTTSKNSLKSNVASVTFTVSSLALTGYSYDSGANVLSSVVIDQTSTNLFPVARDDSFSTEVNTPVSGNVLGNDDLGDTPTTVTAYDGTGTSGGTVTMDTGGNFDYTPPNSAFTGDDSFGYTITDNNGDSSSATVTVSVGSAPPPPPPTLTATPYKVKGVQTVDLAWSGFGTGPVVVKRDGTTVVSNGASPDGSATDNIGAKGGGVTYQYQACDNATSQNCVSASATF